MPISVNQQSPEVMAMAAHWPIADALLGGTTAMRQAGEQYLPQEPRESREDWELRKDTATLFPAFRRTLGVMAGKPFAKALTYGEDVPPEIRALCDDVDLEGRNLHTFASDLLAEALGYGLCGVLVDMPVRPDGVPAVKLAEAAAGLRPYMTMIRHSQILGWRAERINGVMTLTQLRLSESASVPDGPYGMREVERVRVLTPGAWELLQANTKGKYEQHSQGVTSLGAIPFVPVYGVRLGFMRGVSPLLDLAHLNVKHWQQQSDQDDSARFARKRLLVLTGIDDSDVTVGSSFALKLPVGGSAMVVQGSAESVTVGRSELDALESQMVQTGAELLVNKPGQRTATEAGNDAEANKSDLQRMVEGFEDALDSALQRMGDWMGIKQAGHVAVYKDFGATTLSDASAQLILAMQQGGLISKATALREQQRRGMLSPEIQPEQELEAVAEDGPALGLVGA